MGPIRVGYVALAILAASAYSPPSGAAPGGGYASARECAACHKTIHLYWSESEHARSATSKAFLASLDAALQSAADKDAFRSGCVWCHAPTALANGDYALQAPITR